MAQQSRQRTFCVSKSGVIIAGADLGGSSSYSSETALQEWMDFSGKKRIHFLSCRNEFFYKNSNGIIALRAEVEKVSGRAALDSG